MQCEVNGYEKSKDMPPIYITSNDNYSEYINIDVCGNEVTVVGTDMIEAIKNAMNTNRFG